MATRWGICTTGRIASDFVTAVRSLPETEHRVCAVGARSLDSAQAFASKFSIPKAYGSYQELADDPDIDVVYVASVHPYHHKLSLLFLNGGKNILVEKPIAMNVKQTEEIFQLAKERKLFAMEGLWTRFFPAYERIRQELRAGTIGEVKRATMDLSFNARGVERLYNKALGGGAILDLGVYLVQFACTVFDHEKPEKIVATGFNHEHSGVDENVSLTLLYKGKRMAQTTCSFVCDGSNSGTICGPDGVITISRPAHAPVELIIKDQKCEFPLPESGGHYNLTNSHGFVYEAEAVRQSLLKGEKEHPLATHANSLLIMTIMEEALGQMGVSYDDVE